MTELQRTTDSSKKPFDIHEAIKQIRKAIRPFRKAALFELFDDGYTSPFEQLVACLISVRTRDETTIVAARNLFELARTPETMLTLDAGQVNKAIVDSTFHEEKATRILAISRRVVAEYNGKLPCDFDTLISFHGVGPKCANLILGIACGKPAIGVDVHVYRITNRWGYVQEPTPEKTMRALELRLPEEYFVEINKLLVPFGKHICTGTLPRCSICPVSDMCRQVGVARHR